MFFVITWLAIIEKKYKSTTNIKSVADKKQADNNCYYFDRGRFLSFSQNAMVETWMQSKISKIKHGRNENITVNQNTMLKKIGILKINQFSAWTIL